MVAEVRAIAPHGVNTIVEVSPAVNAALDAEVLARHGSVAVYANNGGSTMELPVRPSMVPNVRWQFVLVYNAPEAWRARALEDVAAAVLDGAVRVGDRGRAAAAPLHPRPGGRGPRGRRGRSGGQGAHRRPPVVAEVRSAAEQRVAGARG